LWLGRLSQLRNRRRSQAKGRLRKSSGANWKEPASGEWIRTFAIITTDSNELVAEIHDRMPVILAPADYARWLSEEPDPRDLMRPFPADLMRMWPISTRVNKPENDDPSIIEPIELAIDAA
ncbi:MAG TPA: SOS response-associated peptidase family protein, partial [Pirellulales bacterium]|nr:SOS response-associated peptidase family protein [Pirellulales bacterium]